MYKTLIIVDSEELCFDAAPLEVISFEKYLNDYPKRNETKTRIINLCDTEKYLSKGYYCSLLAEARNHKVLPSVQVINDLRHSEVDMKLLTLTQLGLQNLPISGEHSHYIFFGKVAEPGLQKLATKLFQQYSAPILRLKLSPEPQGFKLRVTCCTYTTLDDELRQQFTTALNEFTQQVWRAVQRPKKQRWDMAILTNPKEKVPPSDREALNRFLKAAAKQGIHAQLLTYRELDNIASYDALFIRETTAIDHYTYRLACKAEKNGLVVIDDPTSILRCCNKVYLHDAFNYQKVPSLKTQVVTDVENTTLDALEAEFGYPLVLKMPEGSFSLGVFKISDRSKLKKRLEKLLKESALVLAQEYLFTEHDWRIGVLNGRAIYACRYFMARDHWQIYNHDSKSKSEFSGGFETLPTFEAPKVVLDAALKAARIIGDGLYGVDIKSRDNHAYVLEVNDNPSIEINVEDAYLGDELYMQIMGDFLRRLESRGR